MKEKTFEEYLQDIHANQYNGLDDEMGESFDEWLRELDVYDVIDYAVDWKRENNSVRVNN